MTIGTMERELAQNTQAPTESMLRGQLDDLKRLIDLKPDPNVVGTLIHLRETTRNHLSALLLRNDPRYFAALSETMSELNRGDAPRGILTPDELDTLLGL
jgi:hypothetical protein